MNQFVIKSLSETSKQWPRQANERTILNLNKTEIQFLSPAPTVFLIRMSAKISGLKDFSKISSKQWITKPNSDQVKKMYSIN